MRVLYTDEQLGFLREHYPQLSLDQLTAAFNARFDLDKTPAMIRSTCKNHKIRCYRGRGEMNRGRRLLLTDEQIDFVKASYPRMSRHELTDALNMKFGTSLRHTQIASFVKNNGIKSGRDGRYQKGNVPFSAGTKGVVKPNKGSFKKGTLPSNHLQVGSTTVETGGYHKTKVAEPDVWKFTHRHVYEEVHGPIPDGHALVFIDGDRDNLALSNLELISRGELAVRNKLGVSNLPAELRPIASKVVKIRLKTNELKRKKRSMER